MFVDSHCHLDKLDYQSIHTDVAAVVDKAKANGVNHLLSVGVTLDAFQPMLDMITPFQKSLRLVVFIHLIWSKGSIYPD